MFSITENEKNVDIPYAEWTIFKGKLCTWVCAAILLLAWIAMGIVIYREREIDFGFGLLMFLIISLLTVLYQLRNYLIDVRRMTLWNCQGSIKDRKEAERSG